jgi:glutathione S-transferase
VKLYDAARCPYCARVRIVLAEKRIEYDTIEIDLGDRPQSIYDLNPSGKVPVLDDGFVLPESVVIMEYLEEQYPQPPLLPADPRGRAESRLLVHRFDELLGHDYYAFRRGDANTLSDRLAALPVGASLYTDFAYVPWIVRAREMLSVDLPPHVETWLGDLSRRPSVARELEVVAAL